MPRRRGETFADIVAQARAEPACASRARPGRARDTWVDPDGVAYTLVDADLSPAQAQGLAARGAAVVHDACGCGGGAECRLDWLSPGDVRTLAGTVPDLHPGKHGRADLEHWRSSDGADLIVVAVDVSRGERIRG